MSLCEWCKLWVWMMYESIVFTEVFLLTSSYVVIVVNDVVLVFIGASWKNWSPRSQRKPCKLQKYCQV